MSVIVRHLFDVASGEFRWERRDWVRWFSSVENNDSFAGLLGDRQNLIDRILWQLIPDGNQLAQAGIVRDTFCAIRASAYCFAFFCDAVISR